MLGCLHSMWNRSVMESTNWVATSLLLFSATHSQMESSVVRHRLVREQSGDKSPHST